MVTFSSSLEAEPKDLKPRSLRLDVEVHDKQQLELEFAYPLSQNKDTDHLVEMYLFVPRNVGIGPHNYPKDSFYSDLNAYLRLDNPARSLVELADTKSPFSPLHDIEKALLDREKGLSSSAKRPLVVLVKLFGHSFRESCRTAIQSIFHHMAELVEDKTTARIGKQKFLLHLIESFWKNSNTALESFYRLRKRFLPLSGCYPAKLKELFENVEEYITAYFTEQLAILQEKFQNQSELYDGSGLVIQVTHQLNAIAKKIAKERLVAGFAKLYPNQPYSGEFYTYRHSIIKKSLQQAFYLETRSVKREGYIKWFITMFATTLGALWLLLAPLKSWADFISGTRSTVLILLVLTYVLREAIQDLTKRFLERRVFHYDHNNEILGNNLSLIGVEGLSGRIKEKTRWINADELPSQLADLRAHPRTIAGSEVSNEEILLYQRAMTLSKESKKFFPVGFALKDILRLNLRHFMAKVDDPTQTIHYYDLTQQRFMKMQAPKVYHLNIILRIKTPLEEQISRHRVVLNKDEIMRIDTVYHKKETAPLR